MIYRLVAIIVVCGLIFSACGGKKKKSMADDGEVPIEEFIEFYPIIKLPFQFSDTTFPKKEDDSLLIANTIYYRFIPDSTIQSFFGKQKFRYYAMGKFANGKEETYLLTKAISENKKVLLLSAFDKERNYVAQLPLIRYDQKSPASVNIAIDPKFNISKTIHKTLPGDIVVQGHDVYILNSASRQFMLIMTDSLGEATGELLNPIDTLPQTQKFTGDYGSKRNLISLRDGQREGRMHIFMHLENEDGCEGELKGEITFISATSAEYRQGGDPCILRFIFSESGVKIEEVEGCGSRLGMLDCSFNGNYSKRKAPRLKEN